MNDVMYKMHVT